MTAQAVPPDAEKGFNEIKVDIEHIHVHDDPRKWSTARKTSILAIVASASMLATFATNIYSPALNQIKADLHASDTQIASSLSSFILVQGTAPLFWSAVSEILGRKIVYLSSEAIFIVGCIVVGLSKSIGVVIGMRCLQAFGSSAVISIGAGTLADIYEPHERGAMMGIYYAAPLLGPALGPMIGGALTEAFDWRATFYFLAAVCTLSLASFVIFFKDTFRRERSLAYQSALARMEAQRERKRKRGAETPETQTTIAVEDEEHVGDEPKLSEKGLEAQDTKSTKAPAIKLSLRDINPLAPLPRLLKRRNNLLVLFASGLLFAFGYSILYTCSRTFSNFYGYNSLQVGLVLLSYGVGNIAGSIFGGRWSDHTLRRLKAKKGGIGYSEMRLEGTKWAIGILPLSSLAYAWLCQKRVHVAAVCVALFFAGFLSIWIYSSTLAYIVDANVGRSTTAVALNSWFRGVMGFVAAEVAPLMQDGVGDGGMYTIWAGLLVIAGLLIALLLWKGQEWREQDLRREEGQ
ncbi:MFS general substrate transporter [Phellopilus nigrolimitatus]|nr:MFS general substrate transporter [Phellopilus nigrolimitatus]